MCATNHELPLAQRASAQQTCGREVCRIEYECYEVPVVCGQNEDGTAIVYIEEVCDPIDVCVQPPCTTQPVPDDIVSVGDVPDMKKLAAELDQEGWKPPSLFTAPTAEASKSRHWLAPVLG